MKKYIFFIFIALVGFTTMVNAQTLQEAKAMYLEGKYAESLPVFEAELAKKKNDASLNHWYGVCLYMTKGDLDLAEKSLLIASKRRIQESDMYLGLIYTEKYNFDLADKHFKAYEKHLTRKGWRSDAVKKQEAEALERLNTNVKRMQQIRRMVSHTEDIQIIDSIVVDKKDFIDAYSLSFSGGSLTPFNEIFNTNKPVNSIVYTNEKETKIYYAQPDTANVYSLYTMEYLIDHFGNEKKMSIDNFGLTGSQNYPFIMPDGVTVYFAAEDDETIGGYDLFVSRYNLNSDTYLKPERLNMPFNSTANDYLLVIDEEKGVGWFASDRNQEEGYVCVYTFIPNSLVKIIQSEDNEYLANRARISSIKDTWEEDADYSALIARAKTKPVKKEKKHKDFEFVINDQLTYYTLQDFKSKAARDKYYEVIQLKSELQRIDSQLDAEREKYINASDPDKALQAHSITGLELKQRQLFNSIEPLEIEARNIEIDEIK